MSTQQTFTWPGPYHKGAMKIHREMKREEAVDRNSRTPPERRSTKRKPARREGRDAPQPR
jgi:hypothetical protein